MMTRNASTRSPVTPLVFRFGRLGDMVLQAPLLHLLHRRFGRPCRLFTRGTWPTALYAGNPDVGEIMQLHVRHAPIWMSPERWRMISALRRHQGPIFVSEDTRGSLKRINRLLHLAGVPDERRVYINECFRGIDEHWVDQLLRFGQMTPAAFDASAYPWTEADLERAPQLVIDARDRADAQDWLRRRGLDKAPLVMLQPGNWKVKKWWLRRSADPKFWPVSNWTRLIEAVHRDMPNANILLCGSTLETPALEAIRRAADRERIFIATADLPIRRLLGVLENAHSMVSVDTGPAHFAAAMGCPLIVLYGSYSARRWSRRSVHGTPVIELGGPPRVRRVADIDVASVIDAWRSLGTIAAR